MKKTKLFQHLLALAVVGLSSFTVSAKYPVLSREATRGGLFGYEFVKSELRIFEVINEADGSIFYRNGYEVICRQPGIESCPKLYAEIKYGHDQWDQTQINTIDYLMKIAIEKEKIPGDYGKFVYKVRVAGENFTRVYELSWNNAKGLIQITRDDIPLT